jgi:hypothetical protein
MSLETIGLCLTFVFSCLSALFFLGLRCQGKGRPFGPRSRRWALPVVVLIGTMSTASAAVLALLGFYAPAALFVFGVAAPGSLCIDRLRADMPDRRSTAAAAATLWLSWLLTRLDDEMAAEKRRWVEDRIDLDWRDDVLLLAAHSYHDFLDERLPESERRRHRIHAALASIEIRLDTARLIDSDLPHAKLREEILSSRLGKDARYRRNLDDLTLLGRRLRHDAVKEIEKLLAVAYGNSLYRLERFRPTAIAGTYRPDTHARHTRVTGNGAARDRTAAEHTAVDRAALDSTAEPTGSRPWHP